MEKNNQVNYVYKAKCFNVVDGDTVDVDIDLGFRSSRVERLRLLYIDTPEMNSKIESERLAAQAAKQFTFSKIFGKEIRIRTHKSDSFGRWLAEVYYQETGSTETKCLNEQLLLENHAIVFKK